MELVGPLDRALGNTRVLVRRVAVANYQHQPVPESHAALCDAVGAATGSVNSAGSLSALVVVAQLRSIVVDLLQVAGLDVLEATDAIPPYLPAPPPADPT